MANRCISCGKELMSTNTRCIACTESKKQLDDNMSKLGQGFGPVIGIVLLVILFLMIAS